MGKPWSKLEIGYLKHPKFLRLNANAICLWHEGKDYCDTFHTDGLIPRDALKLFRFRGTRAMHMLLTASPVQKADGSTFAPLWEPHPLGFKMHDYLDYNDCREEVLARIEDAEDMATMRKIANQKRQAKHRAERKAKLAEEEEEAARNARNALRNAPRNVPGNAPKTLLSRTPTETATATETTTQKPKEQVSVSKDAREQPPPFDVWLSELQADYPQHRVSYGFMTSSLFFEIFQKDPRPPAEVWAEMRANLENQKAGHEWRVKGMAPKLEKWLRDGLWRQRHDADAPLPTTSTRGPAWLQKGKAGPS